MVAAAVPTLRDRSRHGEFAERPHCQGHPSAAETQAPKRIRPPFIVERPPSVTFADSTSVDILGCRKILHRRLKQQHGEGTRPRGAPRQHSGISMKAPPQETFPSWMVVGFPAPLKILRRRSWQGKGGRDE